MNTFSRITARVPWKMVKKDPSDIASTILFNFYLIVARKINKLIGIEAGYNTIPHCRANLLKYQPKAEDLPSRSMRDSFTTAVIPLSLGSTQEHYVNHLGRVRTGRMLEELEMFAGKRL